MFKEKVGDETIGISETRKEFIKNILESDEEVLKEKVKKILDLDK